MGVSGQGCRLIGLVLDNSLVLIWFLIIISGMYGMTQWLGLKRGIDIKIDMNEWYMSWMVWITHSMVGQIVSSLQQLLIAFKTKKSFDFVFQSLNENLNKIQIKLNWNSKQFLK